MDFDSSEFIFFFREDLGLLERTVASGGLGVGSISSARVSLLPIDSGFPALRGRMVGAAMRSGLTSWSRRVVVSRSTKSLRWSDCGPSR